MGNSTSPVSVMKEKAAHWLNRQRKLIVCASLGLLLAAVLIFSKSQSALIILNDHKSGAVSINNQGQVVGYSGILSDDPKHAFFWDKKQGKQELGSLGGGFSQASCINDKGQVVGQSLTSNNTKHAFLWTKEQAMQDLGTLGGEDSFATSINNSGVVVGYSNTKDGESHAFLWTKELGMQDLGTLGGNSSKATCINNAGQIVGESMTAAKDTYAFLWTREQGMQDLGGTPLHKNSAASSINDQGQIVGYSYINYYHDRHAFLWTKEQGMQDLNPSSGEWIAARSINNKGQIVGTLLTKNGKNRAFLWTKEQGIQLLDVIGPPDQMNNSATSINDEGQVVVVAWSDTYPWWVEKWAWLARKLGLPDQYHPIWSEYRFWDLKVVLWTIPSSEK